MLCLLVLANHVYDGDKFFKGDLFSGILSIANEHLFVDDKHEDDAPSLLDMVVMVVLR